MKTSVLVIRWMVGVLFIFSGLIKINDPLGLSYKMQEFFEVGNFHFLNDYALIFAILMNVFEVLAGVAIIIGWQMKLFSWLLLLLIIFFTFLTGYALFSGKIKACGCFGDCLPITPVQSFGKDLFLLVLILFLLIFKNGLPSALPNRMAILWLSCTIITCFFTQWYVLRHLPFIDCLPYKVGNNITDQMKIPAGATSDSFSIQFFYKKKGKLWQFDQANFPTDFDSTYEFINRKDQLVKKGNGLKPAITDFSLQTLSKVDSTEAIFQQKGKYVLLFVQDGNNMEQWKLGFMELLPQITVMQLPIYIVSAEAQKIADQISHVPVFSCDATVLKTAARVKPTYFLMEGATILAKYSYIDVEKLINKK